MGGKEDKDEASGSGDLVRMAENPIYDGGAAGPEGGDGNDGYMDVDAAK